MTLRKLFTLLLVFLVPAAALAQGSPYRKVNPTASEFQDSLQANGYGHVGATEPYDCDATKLGHLWYSTTRDELLECRDVTPNEDGTSPPNYYEWSNKNSNLFFDVRDFGASCTFRSGDTYATLNDDGPAINDAILAASPNGQLSSFGGVVYIPGHCYSETQILWKGGVQLWGESRIGAGIWCGPGMDADCVVTGYGQRHTSTVMRRLSIGRAMFCTEGGGNTLMGGPSIFKTGVTCTRQTTTDTKGSGLHYTEQTADGKNVEEVWFSGHPEFGLWADQGTDGLWVDDVAFFNNGHWAGITGTETGSSTSTQINDTTKTWTTDEWKGYFVEITDSGATETRVRLISGNGTNFFTVSDLDAVDAFTETGATYKIDRGGGLIVEASTGIGQPSGVTDMVGCQVNNVVADGNEPGTILHHGGQTENGSSCTFRNIDVEGSADAACAVWLNPPNESIRIDGINMRGAGSLAAICMNGNGIPRNIQYDNITIKESQTSYYVDMSKLDRADMRLQINQRHRSGHWLFSANNGSLGSGPLWQGAFTEPPYACVQEFNGHYYYDTEDGPCFCDGDANGGGASPVWCTFAGGQGCASTTCANP